MKWLTTPPVSDSPEAIKTELAKLTFLRGIDAHTLDLSMLPAERRRFLSSVGRRLTAQALERRDPHRRHPILLTLVTQSAVDVLDDLVALFDQAVSAREGRARRKLKDALAERAVSLEDRQALLDEILILGTGLRRAEVVGLDLAQLDPGDPAELRRMKKARLIGVRGKGRTSRIVFLGRDVRRALADYLDHERPGDIDEHSEALFLAAATIGTRRPGGRLSPRSINTIVTEIGHIHDLETPDRERRLGSLRPHDLRHTFGYRLSEISGHNRAELERRLGHANDRYLRLYTNPPDDIAASYVEDL